MAPVARQRTRNTAQHRHLAAAAAHRCLTSLTENCSHKRTSANFYLSGSACPDRNIQATRHINMDSAMDDKPPFGTFIPLPGPGMDVPSPKPLRFVFRDGYTYCIYPSVMSAHATDTNLAPAPADAPGHGDMTLDACDSVNIHPSTRTVASWGQVTGDVQTNRRPDTDIKPIIPAANERSRASPSMRPIFRLSMLAEDASTAMETDGGGHVDPEV